jgi:hypothetical protein
MGPTGRFVDIRCVNDRFGRLSQAPECLNSPPRAPASRPKLALFCKKTVEGGRGDHYLFEKQPLAKSNFALFS